MAKHWKEPLDLTRHRDHFHAGSSGPPRWQHGGFAYFVRVSSFTFEFVSLEQLRATLEFLKLRIHPSSRRPVFEPEKGEWQDWHERLPARILAGSRRARVLAALEQALQAFEAER